MCMAAVLPATPVVYSAGSSSSNTDDGAAASSLLGKNNNNVLRTSGEAEMMPRQSARALNAMQDEIETNKLLAKLAVMERNAEAIHHQASAAYRDNVNALDGVSSARTAADAEDDVVRGKTGK